MLLKVLTHGLGSEPQQAGGADEEQRSQQIDVIDGHDGALRIDERLQGLQRLGRRHAAIGEKLRLGPALVGLVLQIIGQSVDVPFMAGVSVLCSALTLVPAFLLSSPGPESGIEAAATS
jgi:hypothetical protein